MRQRDLPCTAGEKTAILISLQCEQRKDQRAETARVVGGAVPISVPSRSAFRWRYTIGRPVRKWRADRPSLQMANGQITAWNIIYSRPAISMAAGNVRTHANTMFLIVPVCSPEPLAAMVPATPLDKICVVDTGMP